MKVITFIFIVLIAGASPLIGSEVASMHMIAQSGQPNIPGWMSILPPLLAIGLALIFREVIVSLFLGVLSGAVIIGVYSDGFIGLLKAPFTLVDDFIMPSLADVDHLSVIVFSMMIAGVVTIVSRNGGMQGIVNRIEPYANSARSGQFSVWIMGVLIFFDDYANTLVVGNTMRPVTDRLKISREKLAYIVDSTAAPVAALAFITTWIGAELGYIQSGLETIPEIDSSPYSIFLNSLAFSFYPVFTLIFILMLIQSRKEFGPMLQAERSARRGEESSLKASKEINQDEGAGFVPVEGIKYRSFNALIPILVIIVGTMLGMWLTGYRLETWTDSGLSFFQKISATVGNANSLKALLWASLSAMIVAVVLTLFQRILSLEETIQSGLKGIKAMLPTMIILVLAWSLALITRELKTAEFLQQLWGDSFSPIWMPALVFVLSALVSFATGSSWGTMAILYPLMMPLSYQLSIDFGLGQNEAMMIMYNVVSVVLAGSVFGDHCSPISDTTILSSMASSCNHIDHVRTQLPYALTVGGVSLLVGTIPTAFGLHPIISMLLGISILALVIRAFAKRV